MENKDPYMLYSQYRCSWWFGDARYKGARADEPAETRLAPARYQGPDSMSSY